MRKIPFTRHFLSIPFVSLMVFMTAAPAFATTFSFKSKVIAVDLANTYVRLYHLNTQSNIVEEVNVRIYASTRFYGFNALRDLAPEDQVSAEVNYNEFYSEYQALQINLLSRSARPPVLGPSLNPTLVSLPPARAPLFQNSIEEEPIQAASRKQADLPK